MCLIEINLSHGILIKKETIEKVFTEGKKNLCLRYTRFRGLKKF